MAKSDIEVNVKTKYDGEGLTKLKREAAQLGGHAKRASAAVSTVSNALGGLNNAAGKAASAVGSLFQAFGQGGVWGMAAAGAMLVVNKLVEGFGKAKEAAKAAADFAERQWERAMANIAKKADVRIKTKIEGVEAERARKSVEGEIRDTVEQQQIESTKKRYAEKRLNVKSAVRQGTYTPKNGSVENDLALLDADEKVEIARIRSNATKRIGDKKIDDFNAEVDKLNAEGGEIVKSMVKTRAEYADAQNRVNDLKVYKRLREEYRNRVGERQAFGNAFFGVANAGGLVSDVEERAYGSAMNDWAKKKGIDQNKADEELAKLNKRLYGDVSGESEAEKRIRVEKLEKMNSTAEREIFGRGGLDNKLDDLIFERDMSVLPGNDFKRFSSDKELSKFLTDEEKASGKLNVANKNRLNESFDRKQLELVERIIAAREEMVQLLGDNSAIKREHEMMLKTRDYLKRKIARNIGGKAELALEQRNLAQMQADEEVQNAERARKETKIRISGNAGNVGGKTTMETAEAGEKEEAGTAIEKAVREKDVGGLIARKRKTDDRIQTLEKSVEGKSDRELRAEYDDAQRKVQDAMAKIKPETEVVKFGLEAKIEERGNLETEIEKLQNEAREASEKIKPETKTLEVQLEEKLKTQGDVEDEIRKIKDKLQSVQDEELKKKIQVLLEEKLKVQGNVEKEISEIRNRISAVPNGEEIKKNLQVQLEEKFVVKGNVEDEIRKIKDKLSKDSAHKVQANLQVQLEEKLKIKGDVEKQIQDALAEIKKFNGEKVVVELETALVEKTKTRRETEKRGNDRRELERAKTEKKEIESGLKQIEDSEKPVKDFAYAEKIADRKGERKTEEKISRLRQLDEWREEQTETLDSDDATVKQKRQAAINLKKIDRERNEIRRELEKRSEGDEKRLTKEASVQENRISEQKKILEDDDSSDDEKKKALTELNDARAKLALVQKTLADKYKAIADALNADKQKALDAEIDKAKKAIADWQGNFAKNKDTRFADWSKEKRDFDRNNVVIGKDANGEDVTITRKQQNNVKSNKQALDRLLKIPERFRTKQQNEDIKRRQAFDDMFNPEKIKARNDALKKAQKEKDDMAKKEAKDVEDIKKMLRNLGM